MLKLRDHYRAWRYRIRHDPDEIRFIVQTVDPGSTVFDVGAHKGAYTYWLKRCVGKTGKVVAFEPQPSLAEALKQRYKNESNLVVEPQGLSSRAGKRDLFVPGTKPSPGATLNPANIIASGKPWQRHQVTVTTLDQYVSAKQIDRLAFIKLDVEGHELEVFQGGVKVLRNHRPILLFESETRHRTGAIDELFSFLTEVGYVGFFFQQAKLRSTNHFDACVHQAKPGPKYVNNFIFTHDIGSLPQSLQPHQPT